ncbi:uncharacterized protein LOC129778970 [Toxorhynchites rutilus septentrionalis]|uniref:uncharacterized protein LOC129778970 n=1 Tax=Toxorhynchites rutilus septentrionalis TaxID=329112 RepID=UPI00247A9B83|nr:uncharacterized protein LOC129778970 [Toxorhynchites rutilus septentrionalis]
MVSSGVCILLLLASLQLALTAPTRRKQDSDVLGCSRSSPDLDDCVTNSIQHFFNFMASGKITPKISVTPFDPLLLPNMTISQEAKGFRAVYNNRYLIGLKNSFVQDTSLDLDKMELTLTLLMPALELLGMYSAESLEQHEESENSILTISIRSSTVKFLAKGEIKKTPTGVEHLQLNLTESDLAMGPYVINDLDHTTHIPQVNRHFNSIPRVDFIRLIEKDLRVQLSSRLQFVANEVLALAPFQRFFPV